jgi:A/G-specific adenine glycosylase
MDFVAEIIKWYTLNRRNLPWRETKDPYKIWISEIILQQTRVDQGLPYYYKFIDKFPNVKSLAKAKEQEVLKYWQGLGYYSRARNLHFAASQILTLFNGKFPEKYNEIIKLKGIGEYTAAAISSFSFNEAKPVLDGNVYRIISRYFGVELPIDKPSTKKVFYEILNELIKNSPPALFNQAIMEFGSLQCKPVNPDCQQCALNISCFAFKNEAVNRLPFKEKKAKVKTLFIYYLIIKNKDRLIFRKRENKGIWKNMYDFPAIESETMRNAKQLDVEIKKRYLLKDNFKICLNETPTHHVLSHRKLLVYFIEFADLDYKNFPNEKDLEWHNAKTAIKLPLPRLIDKYLKSKNYFD